MDTIGKQIAGMITGFGSLRIAVKLGATLYHLHGDHLGSTSLTTRGSAETANRTYYAYGAERSATGDLKIDRTFTGQKFDATGLLYDNACYDDPALSAFISPDSLVPAPRRVIDYKRFLYARVNPLKLTDSSRNQLAQPALWDDPSLCGGPYDIPVGGVWSWSNAPYWLRLIAKVIP